MHAVSKWRQEGAYMDHSTEDKSLVALAVTLGCAVPSFRRSDNPEFYQGWADLVMVVAIASASGCDLSGAREEADRYLGMPKPTRPSVLPFMTLAALA